MSLCMCVCVCVCVWVWVLTWKKSIKYLCFPLIRAFLKNIACTSCSELDYTYTFFRVGVCVCVQEWDRRKGKREWVSVCVYRSETGERGKGSGCLCVCPWVRQEKGEKGVRGCGWIWGGEGGLWADVCLCVYACASACVSECVCVRASARACVCLIKIYTVSVSFITSKHIELWANFQIVWTKEGTTCLFLYAYTHFCHLYFPSIKRFLVYLL